MAIEVDEENKLKNLVYVYLQRKKVLISRNLVRNLSQKAENKVAIVVVAIVVVAIVVVAIVIKNLKTKKN